MPLPHRVNPSATSSPSRARRRGERRRTHRVVGLVAAVSLLAGTPALAAVDGSTPSDAQTDSASLLPSDVTLLRVNNSLLGVHRWYQQMQGGYPVVGGLYAQHLKTSGESKGETTVWDGRVSVGPLATTTATISSATAIAAAVAYTGGTAMTYVAPKLWVLPGAESHLVWGVTTLTDGEIGESHVSYVDAHTGVVLQSAVESQSDTEKGQWINGRGRVFDPNPVVALQDEDLTDDNDSDDAVPAAGYNTRALKHLDKSTHTLVGKWAKVVNEDIAESADYKFFYTRANEYFEQVMSYYALDTEQTFYQRLGFDDVNAEAQQISVNTFAGDNSFYSPSQDLITMGRGGVDDAEDPEVTWHEAGHATQDAQVPGFGQGNEAGAMGEGFGDYIAVTLSQKYGKDTALTPTTCVMDWDATSYTPGPKHCLRTTDTPKTYPDDLEGEVHADGEIWSHALWDINVALGRRHATKAIIEGQFSYSPNVTMPEAAEITVDTTRELYGAAEARKAQQAFEDRGIL